MLRLIFITREGTSLAGARIRCYGFARALAACGIKTQVFSFADDLGAKDGAREGEIGLAEKIKYNFSAYQRLMREKDACFYIQRFNYHVFGPLLAARRNGNKIIFDLDDWEMREDPFAGLKYIPSSKAYFGLGVLAKRSLACMAASRFLETFLRRFNENVHYIPTAVDISTFRPALGPAGDSSSLPLQEKQEKDDKVVFSWMGTFHREEYVENIRMALDCFRLLRRDAPHVYFDICGGGRYAGFLKKTVDAFRDPHIRLRDWVSPDRIPSYLEKIDVGLLPVLRDTKFNRSKCPTKLLEYMAMAKPVVASAIGEAKHIIRDGSDGLLAGTPEAFAAKMRLCANDPLLRQKLGREARLTIERDYSLEVVGRRLASIISALGGP